jgi:hypothetical protein
LSYCPLLERVLEREEKSSAENSVSCVFRRHPSLLFSFLSLSLSSENLSMRRQREARVYSLVVVATLSLFSLERDGRESRVKLPKETGC